MPYYKHIMWDWNGTLLNDVDIVIKVMNKLLKKRQLPNISKKYYKNVFTFPVKKYYQKLGFDFEKESFDDVSEEYITELIKYNAENKLYIEAKKVLEKIDKNGINQSILSASQQDILKEQIKYLGIYDYFQSIVGLNNYYAESKIINGKNALLKMNLNPEQVLFVGDTIHDYEVSQELGCDCLLVSNGHQSYERLKTLNTKVIKSLDKVLDYIY